MPNITLGSLKGSVYSRLENNTNFYPNRTVVNSINEAVRVLNLFAGFQKKTYALPELSTAGRVFYDVPGRILLAQSVTFNKRALERRSMSKMGEENSGWALETTAMRRCPVSHWMQVGIRKFAIHPADSVGKGLIEVTGVIEPVRLINDSDVMNLPNELSNTIVDLAAHVCQLSEGGGVFAQASLLYKSFLGEMKVLKQFKELTMPSYYILEQVEK